MFQLPSFVWSEEYQVQLLSRHFQAFDELREAGFFIGEFIWNFADFMTNQGNISHARKTCNCLNNYLQVLIVPVVTRREYLRDNASPKKLLISCEGVTLHWPSIWTTERCLTI